jgi:hypothetical protein
MRPLFRGFEPVTRPGTVQNARLKRIVAEQALDISMLRDLTRGNF